MFVTLLNMASARRKGADVLWKKIACSKKDLRLDITLSCGQSFRWKELKPGHWTSVLAGHVWTLKQSDDTLFYRVHTTDKHSPALSRAKHTRVAEDPISLNGTRSCLEQQSFQRSKDKDYFEQILWDYFQLDVNLSDLYSHWSEVDANFKVKGQCHPGVRILRQDPVENLFSFICSSNNNISRISLMVEKMCLKFGEFVTEVDGISYYSFPALDVLAASRVEETLRCLGFGYRAKYITETARYIMEHHSVEWLYSLRDVSYEQAKTELMKLCGVGAKVADCVCLMSLDKHNAIPVDTHIWQIVNRDYKQANLGNTKTLTNTVYKQIGDFFRDLWGEYAGWAQSVIFSADLKKFGDDNESASKQPNTKKFLCTREDKRKVKKQKL